MARAGWCRLLREWRLPDGVGALVVCLRRVGHSIWIGTWRCAANASAGWPTPSGCGALADGVGPAVLQAVSGFGGEEGE